MTLFNFWEIKYTVEKCWQQFTEALVETYSLILNGYIYSNSLELSSLYCMNCYRTWKKLQISFMFRKIHDYFNTYKWERQWNSLFAISGV